MIYTQSTSDAACNTRCLRSRSGFTLLEVMVSLVVFTAVALIFATSVPVAEKASHVNGYYAQAASLCQHKIDQLRAVGFGRLNFDELFAAGIIDNDSSSSPYKFAAVDSIADYLPEATTSIAITDLVTGKQARAVVTIKWKSAVHEEKRNQLTLVGIIVNNGE